MKESLSYAIMEMAVEFSPGYGFFTSSTYRFDQLDDLERILSLLAGRSIPEARNSLATRIGEKLSMDRRQAGYEDELFEIRWFKNGNLHVRFKRQDLVQKMNRILAKHYPDALPSRL